MVNDLPELFCFSRWMNHKKRYSQIFCHKLAYSHLFTFFASQRFTTSISKIHRNSISCVVFFSAATFCIIQPMSSWREGMKFGSSCRKPSAKLGAFGRCHTLWWTNIAMENGHRNSGFSHKKLWFSVHQRVIPSTGEDLVGSYTQCHHPNWRTPSFSEG